LELKFVNVPPRRAHMLFVEAESARSGSSVVACSGHAIFITLGADDVECELDAAVAEPDGIASVDANKARIDTNPIMLNRCFMKPPLWRFHTNENDFRF
jgi:hypothetical protein